MSLCRHYAKYIKIHFLLNGIEAVLLFEHNVAGLKSMSSFACRDNRLICLQKFLGSNFVFTQI
jgi:hypothetical protein